MTASHQLTPSQARLMQEHKERIMRIASKAKPDTPIVCLSASERSQRAEVPVIKLAPTPPLLPVNQWVERQIQNYQPWFSIVEEIEPPKPANISVKVIQRICSEHYEVSLADLLSIRRGAEVVKARQVAMFLAKEFTMKSLPEIGRRFGGRDHTTVIHAIKKIKKKESEDNDMAEHLNKLRQQIRGAL